MRSYGLPPIGRCGEQLHRRAGDHLRKIAVSDPAGFAITISSFRCGRCLLIIFATLMLPSKCASCDL